MDRDRIEGILLNFKAGGIGLEDALEGLKALPYEDMGFAKIDNHRSLRKGFPEVVFCSGKTPSQTAAILKKLAAQNLCVMGTRADMVTWKAVESAVEGAEYFEDARIILVGKKNEPSGSGVILVVSGGTSDMPVAQEAALTAEIMGNRVERVFDIGVAGIHRLMDNRDRIFSARVIIVVAGMEGALASIVGGLARCPVIAVPTSVGYGASFSGLAALLSMLNSCAPGVAVVNIDNGFGAGYMAAVINRMGE